MLRALLLCALCVASASAQTETCLKDISVSITAGLCNGMTITGSQCSTMDKSTYESGLKMGTEVATAEVCAMGCNAMGGTIKSGFCDNGMSSTYCTALKDAFSNACSSDSDCNKVVTGQPTGKLCCSDLDMSGMSSMCTMTQAQMDTYKAQMKSTGVCSDDGDCVKMATNGSSSSSVRAAFLFPVVAVAASLFVAAF